MREYFLPVFTTAFLFFLPTGRSVYANEPDSAYIFAYGEDQGSGLYFDRDCWKPDDRTVKPEESTLPVSDELNYELPAYSFSVIRIQTKNNTTN